MTSHYPWLKEITKTLAEQDEIPLFTPLHFSLETFSKELSEVLETAPFSIKAVEAKWQTHEQALQELGENPCSICIHASALSQSFHLLISNTDTAKLTSSFLFQENSRKKLTSSILQEAFSHFILLQAMDCLESRKDFPKIGLKIADHPLDSDLWYGVHFLIQQGRKTYLAVAAFSKNFLVSWNTFLAKHPELAAESNAVHSAYLPIRVVMHSLIFTEKEISSLSLGDFILIGKRKDSTNAQGWLYCYHLPLLPLKVKEESLHIIHPKEGASMKQQNDSQQTMSLKDLPLEVHVELGMISLTIAQLKGLEPGNILPLENADTVYLSIQGKRFAEGELTYLGEHLGVRVTKIYEKTS